MTGKAFWKKLTFENPVEGCQANRVKSEEEKEEHLRKREQRITQDHSPSASAPELQGHLPPGFLWLPCSAFTNGPPGQHQNWPHLLLLQTQHLRSLAKYTEAIRLCYRKPFSSPCPWSWFIPLILVLWLRSQILLFPNSFELWPWACSECFVHGSGARK